MSGTGASSSGSLNPGALASHLNFPGLDRINIRKRLALQDQQENDPDEVVYMDEEGISHFSYNDANTLHNFSGEN